MNNQVTEDRKQMTEFCVPRRDMIYQGRGKAVQTSNANKVAV